MGFKSSENTLNDTTVVDTWCYLLVQTHRRMWETWVRSLGWEDPLENGTATHSSILAWGSHGLYRPWGSPRMDVNE